MTNPTTDTDLAGITVPGGYFEIAEYESAILRDTVYATASPVPHPIAAFIGAQRGMGVSVEEFFAALHTSIAEGPVLAETTIELTDDLRADHRYRVAGAVADVARKTGAAFGRFDLIRWVFTLSDDSGVVATVTNVYAVRRGEPGA
ncbi:hypothetical protein AB0H42_00870 [Nocardia sp. NPDC050799]|uniref:hypothetical protein n=1 Tax=Nocardia sp. NPDC050799 TaxID=3154842 RepID=UPI0033F0FE1E